MGEERKSEREGEREKGRDMGRKEVRLERRREGCQPLSSSNLHMYLDFLTSLMGDFLAATVPTLCVLSGDFIGDVAMGWMLVVVAMEALRYIVCKSSSSFTESTSSSSMANTKQHNTTQHKMEPVYI